MSVIIERKKPDPPKKRKQTVPRKGTPMAFTIARNKLANSPKGTRTRVGDGEYIRTSELGEIVRVTKVK